MSLKFTRTVAAVPPVMLSKGQGLVYTVRPIEVGLSVNSVGYFAQTNVSWTKRVRRKAIGEKYCAWMPRSVRIPTLGAPLLAAQSAAVSVLVAMSNVGHVPVVAVKRSV